MPVSWVGASSAPKLCSRQWGGSDPPKPSVDLAHCTRRRTLVSFGPGIYQRSRDKEVDPLRLRTRPEERERSTVRRKERERSIVRREGSKDVQLVLYAYRVVSSSTKCDFTSSVNKMYDTPAKRKKSLSRMILELMGHGIGHVPTRVLGGA